MRSTLVRINISAISFNTFLQPTSGKSKVIIAGLCIRGAKLFDDLNIQEGEKFAGSWPLGAYSNCPDSEMLYANQEQAVSGNGSGREDRQNKCRTSQTSQFLEQIMLSSISAAIEYAGIYRLFWRILHFLLGRPETEAFGD